MPGSFAGGADREPLLPANIMHSRLHIQKGNLDQICRRCQEQGSILERQAVHEDQQEVAERRLLVKKYQ